LHVVFVGDADGAQRVVSHRLDELDYHFLLVRLRKLLRLTVVPENPRTPGQVYTHLHRCQLINEQRRCCVAVTARWTESDHRHLYI